MSARSILAILILLGSAVPAWAQTIAERLHQRVANIAAKPASKLRVILVGDTNSTELAAEKDLDAMAKLIADSFKPQEYGRIERLTGDDVSKKRLLDLIGSVNVDKDTALLLYISSHGRYQDDGQHVLQLGTDVSRKDIIHAIRARSPQVGILLTDACANKGRLDFQKMINVVNWEEGKKLIERLAKNGPLPTNEKTVRYLLMHHQGIVDVNACLPGQQARTDIDRGGYFTLALVLASCHDRGVMAPPPARGPVPAALKGKVEGRDFKISNQKVDRNNDGNIDWHEFCELLVKNYLAVFHGAANQSPWIICLNDDAVSERNPPQGIEVYFGVAEATEDGLNGKQKVGVGRTILVAANEGSAREFILKAFPNRKDIFWAANVDAAKEKMRQAFAEAHGKSRIVDGTLQISVRPKFGPPPSPPPNIPPQPGRANINNREYLDWLEKYYPAEFKNLMDRHGDLIRKVRQK